LQKNGAGAPYAGVPALKYGLTRRAAQFRHPGDPVLDRQFELLQPADLDRIDKAAHLRAPQMIVQPLMAF
jgi:hypothetical protein